MTAPVLIFGATGGVGAALARRLVAAGRPLHLCGRRPEAVRALADELGAPSSVCDVTDTDAVSRTVAEAAGSGLSGLVYCPGSIVIKPLKATSADDFMTAFRLNVVGAAEAVRAGARALAANEGAVVLFSTVAAGQGFANHAAIAAAKGAVEALTRALATELAPAVRVNCIAPSLTRTPLAEPLLANAAMGKALAEQHPLRRLGEPDDIAATAAFLLDGSASWITGQVIGVDGGRSALRVRG